MWRWLLVLSDQQSDIQVMIIYDKEKHENVLSYVAIRKFPALL